MATFDFLKSYRLNSKDITPSTDSKHVFYPVAIKDIIESESRLGFLLPDELDEFYKEIGYGFLNHRDKRGNFNRFLPPASVADINLRADPYKNDPDLEAYDDPTKIIFFELSEGLYLTIDKDETKNQSPVYYFEDKIADSIADFIKKYEKNPDFIEEYE
jgi:hypothetical protein